MKRRRAWVFPVVTIVTVLAIWYGVAVLLHVTGDPGAAKLPYPHEVLATYLKYPETFIEATWSTVSRAIVGFAAGVFVGVLLGIVMIQSRWIESAIVPYILASQMIPLVALVPIVRAVVRDPDVVRLYITAYVSFFVVTIALLRGLKNVSPTSLELMESYERVALDDAAIRPLHGRSAVPVQRPPHRRAAEPDRRDPR